MTSNQFCSNHPLVAAIDQCATCEVSLCGLCANFADTAVYCEDCYKNYEAEKLVKATKTKMDLPKSADFRQESEQPGFSPPTDSRINFKAIRTGIYLIIVGGLSWSLYSYNQPKPVTRDASIVQLERTQSELIACLAVFAQIGQQLNSGNEPSSDLRCNDTTLSNKVQKSAEEIRIVHPNPSFYATKEIYVTDKSPIPIVVPLDE